MWSSGPIDVEKKIFPIEGLIKLILFFHCKVCQAAVVARDGSTSNLSPAPQERKTCRNTKSACDSGHLIQGHQPGAPVKQ